MSAPSCPRVWEAEAVDDGRLGGSDRASFERHAATCAACRDEIAALAKLRAALEGVAPAPATALEQQRARAKLLRVANDDTRDVRSPWRRRAVTASVALVLLASVAVYVVAVRRPSSPKVAAHREDVALLTAAAPRFDARSSSDAIWLPHTTGMTTRVELTRGSVSFVVPRLEPSQRFLVTVPDGEIEVRGTSFTVVVERGRTVTVNVTEGEVALRLEGHDAVTLRAGELWPPPVVAAALASPPRAPIATHPTFVASGMPATRTFPSPPGAMFDDAFASFEQGAYADADTKLERFEREYPAEPRAEDAAYLRAVARSRLGDREGAAALARAYLAAYPNGFRRPEAERLAR